MKIFATLFPALCALHIAYAANSFAGSNLYYAAGLSSSQRTTLLDALQSAGMKVLRVWLDGESTGTTKNTPITTYPALEHGAVGQYDPTVLNLLDAFMVDAHAHGIKLLISMHSWNAFAGGDVYNTTFGAPAFYTSANATGAFDDRLRYVLNHEHATLGKPWKALRDYIFAFEAENEAMIGLGQQFIEQHQDWQCDRATTIKNELGSDSGILVTTGGESWTAESVQDGWLNCTALDVVAIHAYSADEYATAALQPYVKRAQAAGKKLLMEEWGACYFASDKNTDCNSGSAMPAATRSANIQAWARQITAAGVPWLYWEVLPNTDPHYGGDYEVGVGDAAFTALSTVAHEALNAPAAFDFSEYLL